MFILGMLVVGAALTGVAWWVGGLRPAVAAGMFAGSFTNTPTLAAVLDYIKAHAPATLPPTVSFGALTTRTPSKAFASGPVPAALVPM